MYRCPPNRKGIPLSEEHKQKISAALKGKTRSEEHCKKISESHKGHKASEETKRKMSETRKGHPTSLETRKKISESNKGKHKPEWTKESRQKLSKTIKGRPLTEEWKKKIGETNSKILKGRTVPDHVRIKISNSTRGEKSCHWKGGMSFLPYCYKFDKHRRYAVRKFFNFMCIVTGELERDCRSALSVHHVDHDKEQGCNGKPFNLVPMTKSEHMKEIYREKEYTDYINKTLREGFKWGIWNEQEYIERVMYDE